MPAEQFERGQWDHIDDELRAILDGLSVDSAWEFSDESPADLSSSESLVDERAADFQHAIMNAQTMGELRSER
jgi:hypothetical protein